MKKIIFSVLALVLLAISCKTTQKNQLRSTQTEINTETSIPIREHSIQSVLWQQLSAEYKALCYQAFNTAKYQLDNLVQENKNSKKPLAIVTDIDETLIDNSPYNANMIKEDVSYSKEDWVYWGKLEQAEAVPGAIEFLKYASSKGIEIFYLSNRYKIQEPETISNLKKLGFPKPEEKFMLLRTSTSGKEDRRQTVLKNYNTIMLLGDNLSDFSELFDKKSTKERAELVEKFKNDFGKSFIVLPNPMYGDWETKGLYQGNYNWSAFQKDSIRRHSLRVYR